MYANRYAPTRFSAGSLIAAIGVNAGLAAVLLTLSPSFREKVLPRDFTVINIPIEIASPPEPVPPPPEARASQMPPRTPDRVDVTRAMIPSTPSAPYQPPVPAPPHIGPATGTGTGTTPTIDPVIALPKLVGSAVDPRYARDFQPDYPPSERRAEQEGIVIIRVLIGIDGRVKQVQRVSAASDAFWRVTEAQALRRWRFRPATRDGIPEESWKQFTVRFEMDA